MSAGVRLNRRIVAELERLVLLGIIGPAEASRIAARYPTEPWDILVLVRWFTILGAVAAAVGVVLLAHEGITALRLGELGLTAATPGLIALARWVTRRKRLPRTGAALELAAGFALQGLTTLVAIDLSTGSRHWSALVGLQAALLAALAYALRNRLVLIHAGVCGFFFFGAETGYVSGWGAYWLGMDYPVRFVAAGLVTLGIAWLHARRLRGAYQAFSRVYAHLGLLAIHLALWFLAVFGHVRERGPTGAVGERVAFTATWAGVSVACLWLAGVWGQRSLRGYGLTFLIINVYTFYFQFVVARSGEVWWLHLLLVGGTLVGLGAQLERRLRRRGAEPGD